VLQRRLHCSIVVFLDWFGDWSDQAFHQVGVEFTHTIDLDLPSYTHPALFPIRLDNFVNLAWD
jgi:hypothetical protein